jgi:hypothetical protein
MSPEEKAIALVYKFDNCMEFSTPQRFAKLCALIAVDEILSTIVSTPTDYGASWTYWMEVKQKIEKL